MKLLIYFFIVLITPLSAMEKTSSQEKALLLRTESFPPLKKKHRFSLFNLSAKFGKKTKQERKVNTLDHKPLCTSEEREKLSAEFEKIVDGRIEEPARNCLEKIAEHRTLLITLLNCPRIDHLKEEAQALFVQITRDEHIFLAELHGNYVLLNSTIKPQTEYGKDYDVANEILHNYYNKYGIYIEGYLKALISTLS